MAYTRNRPAWATHTHTLQARYCTKTGEMMPEQKKGRPMSVYATKQFRVTVDNLPGTNRSGKIQAAIARDIRVRELLASYPEPGCANVAILIAKITEIYR